MEQNHSQHASKGRPAALGLVDLVWLAVSRRRLILVCTVVFGAFSLVLSFLLKPKYTATVLLAPPTLVSRGAVLAPAGDASPGTSGLVNELAPSPAELYVGLMQTLGADDALTRLFDLKRVYGDQSDSQARMRLQDNTTFDTDNLPLIRISVRDQSAARAAALADGYLAELDSTLRRIAEGKSKAQQELFTEELSKERPELENAEAALAQAQNATGLIEPREQVDAEIASMKQLEAQLTIMGAELRALKSRATAENPEVLTLDTQIRTLEAAIRRYRSAGGGSSSIEIAPERIPSLRLEIVRRQRAFDRDEGMAEALSRGLEAAKLDENLQKPHIQVVDWATVPDRKSWPPRTVLVVLTAFLGALGAYGWVLLGKVLEPERERWNEFLRIVIAGGGERNAAADSGLRGRRG